MPERRRKFSPEFRDEAVKMVIEGNRPIAQVARERGSTRARSGTGSRSIGRRTRWKRSHCRCPIVPAAGGSRRGNALAIFASSPRATSDSAEVDVSP
ncbi:transposase [Amycolatopsis sp. NBC_01488]|uniref:transposase n=1 Tax=Amycolatopsis sp. NBC_01488 TaxID=2903563 RepID=UPI003FA4D1B9